MSNTGTLMDAGRPFPFIQAGTSRPILLRQIIKDIGLTVDEFVDAL